MPPQCELSECQGEFCNNNNRKERKERKEKLRTVTVGILCRSRFANSVHILLKILAHITIRSSFFLMNYYFSGLVSDVYSLQTYYCPVVCLQKMGMRWLCFWQRVSFPPPLRRPYRHQDPHQQDPQQKSAEETFSLPCNHFD